MVHVGYLDGEQHQMSLYASASFFLIFKYQNAEHKDETQQTQMGIWIQQMQLFQSNAYYNCMPFTFDSPELYQFYERTKGNTEKGAKPLQCLHMWIGVVNSEKS